MRAAIALWPYLVFELLGFMFYSIRLFKASDWADAKAQKMFDWITQD